MRARIDNLTGIRGFAALWVVAFHAQNVSDVPYRLGSFVSHGFYGVDLFFVLSGFVLSLVYVSRLPECFSRSWYRKYLVRRFAKIYPLHILTLMLSISLVVAARHFHYRFMSDVEDTPFTALCQAFLVHAFGINRQISWNTVSWSVSAEWFAYTVLLAPMAYGLRYVNIHWIAVLTVILWIALLMLGTFVFHEGLNLTTSGILRITPEFLGGYLLFRIVENTRQGWIWTLAGFLLIPAACLSSHLAFLLLPGIVALLAGLYAGGRLVDAIFGNRLAIIVGEASYSIYLTQVYTLIAINQVIRRLHITIGQTGLAVLVIGITIVVAGLGFLTFRFVEEPLRLAMLARFGSRETSASAADAQVAATIA